MNQLLPQAEPLTKETSLDVTSAAESAQRTRAILLMCCALMCFACLDATGKWLVRYVPVWEVVWARCLAGTVLTLLIVNPWNTPRLLSSSRPFLQAGRSLLLFGSTLFNFLALRQLQLADTMAISFALPLTVSLLAGPILGEWVGPRRFAAILIGFAGVLIVVQPGVKTFEPAMGFSVAGLFCYAFYNISTRVLATTDKPKTTVFYSTVAGVAILTPLLPTFWVWPQDWFVWLCLGLVGLFGGFGHGLLVLAHAKAPAAVLAPFVYTQIVWMTGMGYLVFGDVPGHWTIIGALIVVASGLYLFARDRVVKGKG